MNPDFTQKIIENNIKEWFRSNPTIFYSVRGDKDMVNFKMVAKQFMAFIRENPRHNNFLKKMGVIEHTLTLPGYIFIRRIAEGMAPDL